MTEYVAPSFEAVAFHCPHCGTYAEQFWGQVSLHGTNRSGTPVMSAVRRFSGSTCGRCREIAMWSEKIMIYPLASMAPEPNPDLPPPVREDYLDASRIAQLSPRGAAALLRLAIQKLCRHLGRPGNNLNQDLASLVKQGLPDRVVEALRSVPISASSAVHPGEIDVSDDPVTVMRLFKLVNIIADKVISEPRQIAEAFGLPGTGTLAAKKIA